MMNSILKICFYFVGWMCAATRADIPCPALHPCTCTPGVIDCEDRQLSHIPTFSQVAGDFHTLKLGNNSITAIPDNSFSSLSVVNISLNNNHISRIGDAAFSGVADKLLVLNLANNQLTTLPPAIAFLTVIQDLDVSWNLIPGYRAPPGGHHGGHGTDGLNDAVMKHLGLTLIKFSFGGRYLTTWPHSLSHLNQLQELRVSGLYMDNMLTGCFHGFEHTLHKLTIDHATLYSVPLCISDLTHLTELHLDFMNETGLNGEPHFGDSSMVSAPFDNMAETLQILSLKHDGLTTFPENIKDLKNLRNLSLAENNLEFISDEAINLLKHSNITTLSLQTCNLKRVPGAISDLQILKDLDLKGNLIRSIESTDLENLANLESLDLSHNPLKYISDNSLCGLQKLKLVNLEKTLLTELSASFKNLVRLETMKLKDARIDCTCDMAWLARWKVDCQRSSSLTIEGQCETIDQSINDYVEHRLITCQDYSHIAANCSTICTHGNPVPTKPGK